MAEEEAAVGTEVPVVVRLGVLSMFPVIEALRGVQGVNFEQLCSKTLGILLGVLSTLPPFALYTEPKDCMDAFQDFVLERIKAHAYIIDSASKAQVTGRELAYLVLSVILGG